MRELVLTYKSDVPEVIDRDQSVQVAFALNEPGFAEFTLTASCDGDWQVEERESVMLQVWVNGEYNQDVVLFYGERWLEYPRLLGYLDAGDYEVELRFHELSSPLTKQAQVKAAEVHRVSRDSELGLVYRYAPVLYGRNLGHPAESTYTDTPMVVFYSLESDSTGTILEYQVLYSHEDEGTPAPMLMAKWGRLTDIEWTLRVELDRDHEVVKATYQGLHHVTTEYLGGSLLGGHPVLQAASAHGMVTDVPTSGYRFLITPAYRWNPAAEPRERVMDAFPFTYQMMAWEYMRHRKLSQLIAAGDGSEHWQVRDVRDYLYVQTSKWIEDAGLKKRTCVDIRVRLKGSDITYSSSFGHWQMGDFKAAYDGPYEWFSTTVQLPQGTTVNDIASVEVELWEGGADTVKVRGLKAFMLDESYVPGMAVETGEELVLTGASPVAGLWCAQ